MNKEKSNQFNPIHHGVQSARIKFFLRPRLFPCLFSTIKYYSIKLCSTLSISFLPTYLSNELDTTQVRFVIHFTIKMRYITSQYTSICCQNLIPCEPILMCHQTGQTSFFMFPKTAEVSKHDMYVSLTWRLGRIVLINPRPRTSLLVQKLSCHFSLLLTFGICFSLF